MDTGIRRSGHRQSRRAFTIGQLTESYLLHATEWLAPETLSSYRKSILLFVAFVGEARPANDITELDALRWMKARLETAGPNTVRSDHARVRACFKWACGPERRLLDGNPIAAAKPPKEHVSIPRAIDAVSLGKMLAVCQDSPTEYRDRAMLWLLWDTGMRVGELPSLELRDFDFEALALHVRPETTKTKSERWPPFTRETKLALHDYMAFERGTKPGPMFVNSRTGRALYYSTLKHRVMEIADRAGFDGSAHDFRRAFVERMQAAGMSDSLIMTITGHSSIEMVRRYSRRVITQTAQDVYRRMTS